MVIVIVVLAMASIGIVPLQLSLESMVLLRQVLFSIMIRVSPSVPPSLLPAEYTQRAIVLYK